MNETCGSTDVPMEKKPSQIQEELMRLDKQLADLDGVIGVLEDKLTPVLSSGIDENKKDQVQESLVPLAESIRKCNDFLGPRLLRLQQLIGRIDL